MKSAVNRREFFIIGFIFIVLVLAKIILALSMQCPSIIGDETVYSGNAIAFAEKISIESILDMDNPPFYSVLLSIAYIFGDPAGANYHLLLIINAFLAGLILFPAYFLLRDYCPYKIAVSGAVLISVVPPVFNWGFYIMTETLFTTLLVYSFYAINKLFRENKPHWFLLTLFTLVLLFGTKAIGVFQLPAACVAAILFVMLSRRNGFFKQIKKIQILFIACISLMICIIMVKTLFNQSISAFSQYNTGGYLSNLIGVISSPDLFVAFVILFIRECQILVLLTYLVLFVSALFLLFTLVKTIQNKGNDVKILFSKKFANSIMKVPALLPAMVCLITYITLTTLMYLVLVTNHMLYVPTWQYVGQADMFQIFSRYLDPIVPGVLIIGIIGMSTLNFSSNFTKTAYWYISALILSLPLFYFNFPFLGYRLGDTLSVFSYSWLSVVFKSQLAGFFIVVLLFFISTLFFLFAVKKSKKHYFLIFLIAVSLLLSGYTYTLEVHSSQDADLGWGGVCGKSMAEYVEDNAKIYAFYANEGNSVDISQYIIKFYLKRPVSVLTKEELMSENFTASIIESGVPTYLVSDVPVMADQKQSIYGYPGFVLQLS